MAHRFPPLAAQGQSPFTVRPVSRALPAITLPPISLPWLELGMTALLVLVIHLG